MYELRVSYNTKINDFSEFFGFHLSFILWIIYSLANFSVITDTDQYFFIYENIPGDFPQFLSNIFSDILFRIFSLICKISIFPQKKVSLNNFFL